MRIKISLCSSVGLTTSKSFCRVAAAKPIDRPRALSIYS